MTVEVFKTNVRQKQQATQLVALLHQYFPACKINFDLEDCDKILRIEGKEFMPAAVIKLVHANGFCCSILE